MEVAGGVVVQMADIVVVQVVVGAVVEAGGAVVEVAGCTVVEVACGGAGGQPVEEAVPGPWARTAWGLSFCLF
jgi:hypothetical protein